MAKYSLQQIKDIIGMQEETMMKFFNSTIERLEVKIQKISEENILLKSEVVDLKASISFQNDMVEDLKTKLSTYEKKDVTEGVHRKLSELEDRSRRNNLRINGIEENEHEDWDESEKIVKKLINEELNITNVTIERAHRSGRKTRIDGSLNTKRTIIVKFQNYKDKTNVINEFKAKKLWEKKVYINEDFSEMTTNIRKNLFKKVKELKENGIVAKVVYNRLVYANNAANE